MSNDKMWEQTAQHMPNRRSQEYPARTGTQRLSAQYASPVKPRRSPHDASGYEVDLEEEDERLYPSRLRSSVRYRPLATREDDQPSSQALTMRGRHDLQRYDGGEEVNVYVRRRSAAPTARLRERLAQQRAAGPDEEEEEEVQQPETEPLQQSAGRYCSSHQQQRQRWLTFLSVGILVMLALWIAGSWVVAWWHLRQEDGTYGRPRTYQCDAVVGHHDSRAHPSHFIALNLNRHVEIIEFPGGDASAMKVYVGPVLLGDGQDLTPVTLSFRDVNGDGQPDMLVTLVGQDTTIVFVNDHGQFRPQRPGEQV